MTTSKSKAARDAIIKARTCLVIRSPFFGCLALHMKLVEITDERMCDTMAVDGKNLYYWPAFVNSLGENELVGVVAHEVMHCCYKHMVRRGNRHPVVYNWAGDYVINADLLAANFTLPEKRLHDPKYNGMSTEEVYELLYKDVKKITINMGGNGNGQNGEGQGPNGGPYLPQGADKGGCGGVIDAAPQHDKAATTQIEAEWESNVRMAVNVAKRANAGTVPGYLQRLVTDLEHPKVSWRDLTRQFIDGAMHKDYSWSRPNRRFIGRGMILPGFVPDALHHLVMIGDVSGSITDDIMRMYLGEVAGALDEGVADKLTTVYVDTEIKGVEEFLPGDVVKCNVKGGGGTDFRPAFEWVRKNAQDASCIVFLTDMLPCSWDIPEPDCPTLWGAYLPESQLAQIKPPFGMVVHVDGAA